MKFKMKLIALLILFPTVGNAQYQGAGTFNGRVYLEVLADEEAGIKHPKSWYYSSEDPNNTPENRHYWDTHPDDFTGEFKPDGTPIRYSDNYVNPNYNPNSNADSNAGNNEQSNVQVSPKPQFTIDEKFTSEKKLKHVYALIIGIKSYASTLIPEAPYSERDAASFRDYIEATSDHPHIIYLTGAQATTGTIKASIKKLGDMIDNWNKHTYIFVYYSGHGGHDILTDSSFIATYDNDVYDSADTSIETQYLIDQLGKLPGHKMLVLDSCFSGLGPDAIRIPNVSPLMSVQQMKFKLPSDFTLATAAKSNEYAASDSIFGHGLFTYYFLYGAHLQWEHRIPDGRHAFYAYIRKAVSKRLKEVTPELRQTPQFLTTDINRMKDMQFVK